MRVLSIGTYIGTAAVAALVVGSLAPASASPVRPLTKTQSVHQAGHIPKNVTVAPGKAGQLVNANLGRRFPALPQRVSSGSIVRDGKFAKECIYVSDNSSSLVHGYVADEVNGNPQAVLLGPGYGWGLADTKKILYAGSATNQATMTVDLYKQCGAGKNGKPPPVLKTLVSPNAGNPYGMWASDDGSLLAVNWPNKLIEAWDSKANGYAYLGASVDNAMALPYFVWWDALDAKSAKKGEGQRILVSGWNFNYSAMQVDSCTGNPGGALNCVAIVPNAGGFPGGILGYNDLSSRPANSQVENMIANDQFGTLSGYNCDLGAPGPPPCTLLGKFNYAAGASEPGYVSPGALDYTGIALSKDCSDVWGANIFFNSVSSLSGDGSANSDVPVAGMLLGDNTPVIGGAVPLGIAYSPPCKIT